MGEQENYVESIHNEDYYRPFSTPNISHESMIFTGGRTTEKLNGQWHYVEDLYDVGFRDSWHRPRATGPSGPTEPWDFNAAEGELTDLPGCWNVIDPRLFYFEGTVWYSRSFPYEAAVPGERLFLRIGAANYDTKIFMNTRYLGHHAGGSTPFFVELTDVAQGSNELLIGVNNTRENDRVPMKNTDWYNWGGIYRDIELLRLPATFIRDFTVALTPGSGYDEIAVSCELSDRVDGRALLAIPDLAIEQEVEIQAGLGNATLAAKPDLWCPENPRLYEVSLTFEDDSVSDSVGFRQVATDGTSITLNGARIFLKGVSVHEDDAENGKMLSDEDLARRFRHAKELGANFMRLAHYPHDERVAQMADREGILLWEEIPVYWAIAFGNEATFSDAENQLTELIKRDRNRASVILWSVGNENADTDARLSFMSRLAQRARTLDPTRLVTAACLVNHAQKRIEDRLAPFLDVIGLNEYYGWYEPDFDNVREVVANSSPDRPVIISEFGAGAKAGNHGPADQLFTEEYMEHVYQQQIEVIRDLEYVSGMTPWILYDFTCPRRKNRFQRGYNRKGLIAEDKTTKKKAFFTLQAFYRELR